MESGSQAGLQYGSESDKGQALNKPRHELSLLITGAYPLFMWATTLHPKWGSRYLLSKLALYLCHSRKR